MIVGTMVSSSLVAVRSQHHLTCRLTLVQKLPPSHRKWGILMPILKEALRFLGELLAIAMVFVRLALAPFDLAASSDCRVATPAV